jgi:hypothetical protein
MCMYVCVCAYVMIPCCSCLDRNTKIVEVSWR